VLNSNMSEYEKLFRLFGIPLHRDCIVTVYVALLYFLEHMTQ
jgi:hypothetical protein